MRSEADKLSKYEERVLRALEQHKGRANAISADRLADRVGLSDRELRELINHLIIRKKIPVLSLPGNGGGYFMVSDKSEVEACVKAMKNRAVTGFKKQASWLACSLVDVCKQTLIEFDAAQKTEAQTQGIEHIPAQLQIVTDLLDQYAGDPGKYAAELNRLQRQYAPVFLRRERLAELRKAREALDKVLSGLEDQGGSV